MVAIEAKTFKIDTNTNEVFIIKELFALLSISFLAQITVEIVKVRFSPAIIRSLTFKIF
jgi:hypothetical protein